MSIKISIVEDQHEMRESLVAWLGDAPGLKCVGAHATGEDALKKIPGEKPDVVLMDINLTGMNGIQCVSRLRGILPKTQILMLTTYDEGDMIFESLRAGANGYLLKNMPQTELVAAVQQVHAGGAPMSLQIARKVINHFHHVKPAEEVGRLTGREQEILKLLAKGYMYKEIADQLSISMSTVRSHVCAVYDKLHVHSRTEAAMKLVGEA
ncbi:MAG TPA: response regulator transcription factor [Candidatus Polarisedimenticolia bacterium]|nr:response regulator transcription factor [Candidatus Polarisedimenticolia bacterium]